MRLLLLLVMSGSAWGAVPLVMFTDLISGPNTGGENNNGTILTIYGKNFGATRGTSTVTVGGGSVAAYLAWGGRSPAATSWAQLETISVAIGSSAATGTVVVTTSAGSSTCLDAKDSCQFTVRSGNIRCVSTSGSDGGTGNFPSSCWATIPKAAHTLASGDIAYILNGVSATGQDNFNANVMVSNSCTSGSPCALVAYPGATVHVGSTPSGDQNRGVYLNFSNNWVVAGLVIRATLEGIQNNGNNGARIVGNDISCPNGDGQDACFHAEAGAQNLILYGNYSNNTGTNCSADCKEYHTIYLSTNVLHVWIGWNEVAPNPSQTSKGGCRAIQFYSTSGSDQYDVHIHDNYIHDSICDGLNLSTMDSDLGTVEAYNNVIFRVGTGPTPTTSDSNYACVNLGSISGITTTPVQIYNNTMYNCGARGNGDSGAITVCGGGTCSNNLMVLTNNIIQQPSSQPYFSSNVVAHASCANFTGSTNNIMYGNGANTFCTGTFASNANSNPSFVSTATPDFHLSSSGSPANGAGTTAKVPTWDFDGLVRPSPPALGAYEYAAASNVGGSAAAGKITVSGKASVH